MFYIESNTKAASAWRIEGSTNDQGLVRLLIVGPPASGKTSVLNAIELAVGGYASDVLGRAATSPAFLKALNATLVARVGVGSSEVRYAKGAGDPSLLPCQVVRDSLLGSSATTRSALLGMVGAKEPPLPDLLRDFQRPGGVSPADHAAKMVKVTTDDLRAFVREYEALKKWQPAIFTEADRVELLALQQRENVVNPVYSMPVTQLEQELLDAEAVLALFPSDAGLAAMAQAHEVLACAQLTVDQGYCVVCGDTAGLDDVRLALSEYTEAREVAAHRHKARGLVTRAEQALAVARRGSLAGGMVALSSDERVRLTALRRLREAASCYSDALEQLEAKSAERWPLEARAEAAAAYARRLWDAALATFNSKVSAFAPGPVKLSDFADRVCMELHGNVALSGTEGERVVMAIAAAGAKPGAWLMPKDCDKDPAVVAAWAHNIDKAPCHVVLTCTEAPAPDALPPGWCVVAAPFCGRAA